VFRDEMGNLLPDHERAKRLAAQTFFFDEFLDRYARDFRPPPLRRKAIVHAHCHRKALCGKQSGSTLVDRAGLDGEVLDSGCCGMAGQFGFERAKVDVSIEIGEQVLLPRVRQADPSTLIVADGYSCREQIVQCTGETVMHPAEVLALALRQGGRS
jgi:Fe-S oxidoreductase